MSKRKPGVLVTYRAGTPRQDTGLRFEKLTNGCFLCPLCHTQIEEPEFEFPPDA